MPNITADDLRTEFASFTRDVLQRELAALRKNIVNDLLVATWPNEPVPESKRSRYIDPFPNFGQHDDYTEMKFSLTPRSDGSDSPPLTACESERFDSRAVTLESRDDRVERSPLVKKKKERRQKNGSQAAHTGAQERFLDPHPERKDWYINQGWAMRLVISKPFTNFITAVICTNVLTFVVQTDFVARTWSERPPAIFVVLELIAFVIFLFEICVRIFAFGWQFFCGQAHRTENLFDFALVASQGCEILVHLTLHTASNVVVGLLRVLRIARILRITRVLHLLPELHMLVVSILSSWQQLFWVFALLGITTGVFAVAITTIVNDFKIRTAHGDDERHILDGYFGSVDVTMLRLYQTISEGVHWDELAEPLMEHDNSKWTALIFVSYSFFVNFALVGVVMAFFVETALHSAQKDYAEHMSRSLWEMFQKEDHDGVITREDFDKYIERPQFNEYFHKLEIPLAKVKETSFFELLDTDNTGELSASELMEGCIRLMGPAKAVDLAGLSNEVRKQRALSTLCHNEIQHLSSSISASLRLLTTSAV